MTTDRSPTQTGHRRIVTDGGDMDHADLDERLQAVERALTGDDRSVADLHDEATATAARESLADRVDDLESQVAELTAATQAVRGYVGSIRAVNREVERRADLALARATDGRAEPGTQAGAIDPGEESDVSENGARDTIEPLDARCAAIAAPDTVHESTRRGGEDADRNARTHGENDNSDVISRIRGVL